MIKWLGYALIVGVITQGVVDLMLPDADWWIYMLIGAGAWYTVYIPYRFMGHK